MKIIAFGGSNSQHSINKKLAAYAANQFENGEVEVLDLNDFAMPLFSVDLEKEIGQEPKALAFLKKISEAAILVVSLAENNGNYSAAFKNVFDWASRIEKDVFQHKPMLLLSTSPGPRGGATVSEIARNAFPRYGGDIKASFSLPSFNTNFDVEKGEISNEELKTNLLNLIHSNF
ncbi:NADPH-dependent FMN reductase [Flavobacterium reichenbachii]|jgi:chromate reductase|uniref:NADPH-dependent FMN reductase n=1 Tax=Flavobacterium reichenbachii TaxID=362418 RepID=A0A085ZNB8_9FLAO|nr:NAD(P)H-dependent oxidoreductase [Flavobacterium reichenbachii]KFF05932.1 NADPH-dependent FMN reductase [Flavobacterium reichenbachii]OXB12815.1 NADPH-dependent oxidoreductase [Flavobacterium reichenbachii]